MLTKAAFFSKIKNTVKIQQRFGSFSENTFIKKRKQTVIHNSKNHRNSFTHGKDSTRQKAKLKACI